MKLAMNLVVLVGVAALAGGAVGCGSSDDDAPTGPVSASPLTGTIEGKEFVGKVALAKKGFEEGEKSIDIYDADVSCADFGGERPPRWIMISVPWTPATEKDFKFGLGGDNQTATFVVQKDGETNNIIATTGRVEIITAPTEVGEKGKIRLRAIADTNKVEGEISVEVCE
jgi:hypothetical protein